MAWELFGLNNCISAVRQPKWAGPLSRCAKHKRWLACMDTKKEQGAVFFNPNMGEILTRLYATSNWWKD